MSRRRRKFEAWRTPDENPNPVLRVARDGSLLYANRSSQRLLAYWQCEEPGKYLPEAERRLVAEMLERGISQHEEVTCGQITYWLMLTPILEMDYVNVYGRDISERKRAEEALREAGAWFRTTLYGIGDAVITTDAKGCVRQMNPVAEAITGWREAEARGKPLAEVFCIVNEESRHTVENPVTRVLREGVVIGLGNHTMLIGRDGSERPIADAGAPIRNDRGETVGVVLVFRDQTAERAEQKVLRESMARYRGLFENINSGVAVYEAIGDGQDFVFKDYNRAGEKIDHDQRKRLIGKSILEVRPSVRQFGLFEVLRQVWQTGEPAYHPVSLYQDNRLTGWYENFVYKLPSGEIMAIFENITERKQAEQALAHSHQQLRALTTYWQNAIETERAHIAREIHDEFGQSMTALKMDLAWLAHRLPAGDERGERIRGMIGLVDESITLIRSIATELRPRVLDDLGLNAALDWQAQEFCRHSGIPCNLKLPGDDLALDPALSTTLFRIFQETLTNVARHAQARRVDASFQQEGKTLILIVQDNGRGITESELKDTHSLGLIGLRERAAQWGGDLTVIGAPGEGTAATVRIPLP